MMWWKLEEKDLKMWEFKSQDILTLILVLIGVFYTEYIWGILFKSYLKRG
jgi:hypothetical protein